jgi:sulfate permease, SulP family
VASPSRDRSEGSLLERLIPAAGWLARYDRRYLGSDLVAGATVAVMLIPQAMAYALLAGVPPIVGLYAATLPLVLYALFGSSRHLAVGPVAIVALLTFSGASRVATPGSAEFVTAAALLALLVGVLQLGLGLLRAGFIANFLSHAVISGFVSAAAIVIALSQLGTLLGLSLDATRGPLPLLAQVPAALLQVHPPTAALGIASLALLLALRRLAPRFPGTLAVVVVATTLTFLGGLDDRGVRVLGDLPRGLPGFALPPLDAGLLGALLPAALTIAFVGFMESIAIASALARKERYALDANRELRGLGLANLGAAALGSIPVTGGIARTAVNYAAGARTPLASLVTAGLVLLVLALFTPLFRPLPLTVLAAIVIAAVVHFVDVREARRLFALKPVDGVTLLVTFVVTLVVGIEQGILAGVAFSLAVFVARSASPHTAELGYLPELGAYRNVARFPQARTYPGTLILRIDASLYFANMAFLTSRLEREVAGRPDLHTIVLDFSGVNDIDAVALGTFGELLASFSERGIDVHVAAMKGPVRDLVQRAGWPRRFGDRIDHLSVAHAVEALGLDADAREPGRARRGA